VNRNEGSESLFTCHLVSKKGNKVNRNGVCFPPSPGIISPGAHYHP